MSASPSGPAEADVAPSAAKASGPWLRRLWTALLVAGEAYSAAIFAAMRSFPERQVAAQAPKLTRADGLRADLIDVLPWAAGAVLVAWLLVGRSATRHEREAPWVSAAKALAPLLLLAPTLFYDHVPGRMVLAASLVGWSGWLAWPLLGLGRPSDLLQRVPHRAGAAVVAGAAAIWLFTVAWMRHQAHWSSLIDLGLFYELYDNAAGHLLHSPTLGQSFMGEHFSPILVLLWPLMKLAPSHATLFAVQSLSLAGAGYLLYLWAHDRLQHKGLAGAIMLAWLVSPFVQRAAFYDFHMDVLFPPALFGAWLALHRGRTRWLIACVVLMWATKEDAFIATATIGAYAWLAEGRRRFGVALIALSLVYAAVVLGLVLPSLREPFDPAHFSTTGAQEGYAFLKRYSHLGSTFGGLLGTLATNPLYVISHLTEGAVLTSVLSLLLLFGGLAIAGGPRLLLLVPTLEILLGNPGLMSHFEFYYGLVAFQWAPIAAVEGARVLRTRRSPPWPRYEPARLAAGLVALTVALALWHPWSVFASRDVYKPYDQTPHHAAAEALMDRIPEGVSVSATGYQAVHLQPGRDVAMFPYALDRAEWVLVDTQRPPWPRDYAGVRRELERLPGRGFDLVEATDGLFLWQRRAPGAPGQPDVAARLKTLLDQPVVEAELSEQTHFLGEVGADEAASNGHYLHVDACDRHGPDYAIYGPYARVTPGRYRAWFRFRWSDAGLARRSDGQPGLTLDVVSSGPRVQAKRALNLGALRASEGQWCDESLDVNVRPGQNAGLELRIFYHDAGDLDVDKVWLERLP